MEEKDYLNFKYLLEYFITHLEWLVNKDSSFIGYNTYVDPLIKNSTFKFTGQGYNGGKIQDQISKWDIYENYQICINISYNQKSGYQSKNCYLNWLWTGINIIAEWDNNHIVGLYQELFIEKKKPQSSIWLSLNMSNSLLSLGLFDNTNTTNFKLKTFYNNFRKAFLEHKLEEKSKKSMAQIDNHANLLKYKKQIILQGPPGTGKTREAKLIAKNIVAENIDIDTISNFIKIDDSFPNASGTPDYYRIKNIDQIRKEVILVSDKSKPDGNFAKFDKIIERIYELQKGVNLVNLNGQDPYEIAVAKFIYSNLLESDNYVKIVQFHPSYTYEDFIRGIVAKPNEDGKGIMYDADHKSLGYFAKVALGNYQNSQKTSDQISKETWILNQLTDFCETVLDEIEKEGHYKLNDKVSVFSVDSDAFRYKGRRWEVSPRRLKFKDVVLEYLADAKSRTEIKNLIGISGRAKEHASYDLLLLGRFKEFLSERPQYVKTTILNKLKHYVFIIDEINRANLSSVLGELIYALEYRCEEVESMYEVDGSQKLILPPNLYIIGTMNTADRSVGHIDYAIRRRFAFVDVLPKELQDDDEIYFNSTDFIRISSLFNDKNVSKEFEIDAVRIGHSYFIVKKSDANDDARKDELFKMKMQYEVKPILLEYERDGILIGEYEEKPIKEYIKSL